MFGQFITSISLFEFFFFFSVTLGGLLNEFVSMIFPAWKFESDPIENQEAALEALDLTLALDRREPVDFTERLEP